MARDFVRRHALAFGFPRADVEDITLAVGEAIANALEHGLPRAEKSAGHQMQLIVGHQDHLFVVTVCDPGPGFEPRKADSVMPTPLLAERGRGLAVMEMLMDRVALLRMPDGMQVRLEKRLLAEPAPQNREGSTG
ncbi:MAG: ATP-binding protein [Armatimonadaceae bacterium]